MTTPEPVDGVHVGADLWLAWIIKRHSLDVQASVLDLAASPDATSGCACTFCARHEQAP